MFRSTLICLVCFVAAVGIVGRSEAFENNEPSNRDNIVSRCDFTNSRIQFERGGRGHVAFMGGSITEMAGYRPMVCEILKRRFPDCQFTFTDAGISSTCSTTGAFRLKTDVLDKGPGGELVGLLRGGGTLAGVPHNLGHHPRLNRRND